jgi:alanyl-tRNA synthetase
MELWNHVTMRFRRHPDGSLEPLPRPNVDTGMGLERLLMVTQDVPTVFDTDVFQPWMSTLPGLWQPDEPSLRLLADHLRASTVIVGDGVRPSSNGCGYVLRRLLRRVLTTLWRTDNSKSVGDLPDTLIEHTLAQFGQHTEPELIREVLRDEERRFAVLMTRGRKVLERFGPGWQPTPADLTYLHQTHGLPPDLVTELLTEPGETRCGSSGPSPAPGSTRPPTRWPSRSPTRGSGGRTPGRCTAS